MLMSAILGHGHLPEFPTASCSEKKARLNITFMGLSGSALCLLVYKTADLFLCNPETGLFAAF